MKHKARQPLYVFPNAHYWKLNQTAHTETEFACCIDEHLMSTEPLRHVIKALCFTLKPAVCGFI